MSKISREPLSVSPDAISTDDANDFTKAISPVTLLRGGQFAALLLAVLASGNAEANGGAGDDDNGKKKTRTDRVAGPEEPCPPELFGGGGASKVRRSSIALGRPATECFPLPLDPKGRRLRPFLNEPVAPGTPGSFAPLRDPVRFALGKPGCPKAFVEGPEPEKFLEFQVTGPVEAFIWVYPVFDPTAINMRIRIFLDGQVMKDDEVIVSPDPKATLEVEFEDKRKLSRPIQIPVTIPPGTHTLMVDTERFGKGGVVVPNSAFVALELLETAAIPPSLPDYGEEFPERPDSFLAAIKVTLAPANLGGFEVTWPTEPDSQTPPDIIAYGDKYHTPGKLEVREIRGKPGIVLVTIHSTRQIPLEDGSGKSVTENVFYQAEVALSALEEAGRNVEFVRIEPRAFSDKGAKGPDAIEADIAYDGDKVVFLPTSPPLPPDLKDLACKLTTVEPKLPPGTELIDGDNARSVMTCVTPPGTPQSVYTKILPMDMDAISDLACVGDLALLARDKLKEMRREDFDPDAGKIPASCKDDNPGDKIFLRWRATLHKRPPRNSSSTHRGKK